MKKQNIFASSYLGVAAVWLGGHFGPGFATGAFSVTYLSVSVECFLGGRRNCWSVAQNGIYQSHDFGCYTQIRSEEHTSELQSLS